MQAAATVDTTRGSAWENVEVGRKVSLKDGRHGRFQSFDGSKPHSPVVNVEVLSGAQKIILPFHPDEIARR